MKRGGILAFVLFFGLAVAQAQPVVSESHPWRGARVAYMGDSITDPRLRPEMKKYWGFLADWLGITPYVYGVNGRQWNDIPRQTDQLREEHGDEVDAILIFVGTNDFNHGLPIGAWYDECDTLVEAAAGTPRQQVRRRMRQPSMNPDTYRGRINIALSRLKQCYPTKQIVLLTPVHRAYAEFGERNVQPSEAYQNVCGTYLDRYVASIREAGEIWAVPVIDLGMLSGLYPLLPEHAGYFCDPDTDLLHPNEEGHRRMALTLLYQLQQLPCRF